MAAAAEITDATAASNSLTAAGDKIKTVVVLVQENRSFDHMLGWAKTINPSIDGVASKNEFSNPLSTADPAAGIVYFGDNSGYVVPDPGHSIQAIYEQIYGVEFADATSTPITPPGVTRPPMNGFAQQAEKEQKGRSETVMNGFRAAAVPVYEALVREFAVCDRWFASVPASTQPNRLFVHSATSHGFTSNDTNKLVQGLPQRTIFDSLHDAGYSFGIYYQNPPATLFYRNLRQVKYIGNFHEFDVKFKEHCRKGKLPNYVVIEQRWFDIKLFPGNDDHPSHDVAEGQKLVKEVYEALRSSPQWNEILFVITYDEHGGFFDHVPTPVEGVPSPDGITGQSPFFFNFDRLGVRVPALFISPWVEKGTVIHEPNGPEHTSQFEHSSIPATVKKIFNLKAFLTKRDAWAGTFDSVLTLTTPRTDCPSTLPEATRLREMEASEDAKLSDFQKELVQLSAVLNGDHAKDVYPWKLVEHMTVAEGAAYVKSAFEAWRKACDKCRESGADGSHVVELKAVNGAKALLEKVSSCFTCGRI